MLETLHLQNLSTDMLLLTIVAAGAIGILVGYIVDSVMGRRGFGPIGNGILITFGALVGVYVRNAYFSLMQPSDIAITGLFAGSFATLLLMLLGLAKHWAQD